MNTLPLMTHIPGGELHPNDLHVLREFAFYAPPEWRHAFDRLIKAAEEESREEKLKGELDELKATVKRAKEKAVELFAVAEKALGALPDPKAVPWIDLGGKALKEHLEELSDGLDELTNELAPDPAATPATPPAPGGSAAG